MERVVTVCGSLANTMAKERATTFGPGTVFRILVPGEVDGVALVTHKHPEFHDLIRVFARRVEADDVLCRRVAVEETPVLSGFTSVRVGIKQGVFVQCGRVDVPAPLQTFPVFRGNGLPDPVTNEDAVYLWDGSREWRVAQTPDVRRLPSRFIWSPTALSELVQVGWTDEHYGFEFFERPPM
jgi:hypothetical protein